MPQRPSSAPGSARPREPVIQVPGFKFKVVTRLSPTLRKAAVLISALDEQAAEAMLQQLTPDEAAKVRRALVDLDEIPAPEQQLVLTEFLRQQEKAILSPTADGDVALELDPSLEAAAADASPSRQSSSTHYSDDRQCFAFLELVEPDALAALLGRELPQTIAVVVAQLIPAKAAAVLEKLPPSLATTALERIAWLDELSPEIRSELASELRRQLAPHIEAATAGSASLDRMAAVLAAMDHRQRRRVVEQLGERNAALLRRLGLVDRTKPPSLWKDAAAAPSYRLESPRPAARASHGPDFSAAVAVSNNRFSFDDLNAIDDATLRAVLAAVDPDIALLALTGAEPRACYCIDWRIRALFGSATLNEQGRSWQP
jgi:flagellar motor switch protein FliG